MHQLPSPLREEVGKLPPRLRDAAALKELILRLCAYKAFGSKELEQLLGRSEKHLLRTYITPLRQASKLEYTIPAMPNHPQQAYKTADAWK